MNLPKALSQLTGVRPEVCLEGTESWSAALRMEPASKEILTNVEGIVLTQITMTDGADYIYADIAGFPSLPVADFTVLGSALYRLSSKLPVVDDEIVYFRPRKVGALVKELPYDLKLVDLKTLSLGSYGPPLDWQVVAAGVVARVIPSQVRNVAVVDFHGVRTVTTPDSVGL